MKNLLSLFIACIIVISCKKSGNDNSDQQKIYTSDQHQYRHPPEMYTAAGKITDTTVIYNYLRRLNNLGYTSTKYDSLFATLPQIYPFPDTIQLSVSGTLGELYMKLYNYNLNYAERTVDILNTNSTEKLLVFRDSVSKIYDRSNTFCTPLFEQLDKYIPQKSCKPISIGDICSYRDLVPIEMINDNEIKILYHSKLSVKGNSNSAFCMMLSHPVFNVPATNIPSMLQNTDTVVIQRRELILQRS